MKRINFIGLFLCCGMQLQARAQSHRSSGTLIEVEVSQNEIIMAADSRRELGDGEYLDDDCKISIFNRKIGVATSGTRYFEITDGSRIIPWDSHEFARKAISASKSTDSILTLASKWGLLASTFLQNIMEQNQGDFLVHVPHRNNQIAEIIFAGANSSGQLLAAYSSLDIRFHGSSANIEPTTSEVPVGLNMMGHYSIANEFNIHQSQRSAAEYLKWKYSVSRKSTEEQHLLFLMQLFKWSSQYGALDIGGDIDVVSVDPKRFRWIYRKAGCNANEIAIQH